MYVIWRTLDGFSTKKGQGDVQGNQWVCVSVPGGIAVKQNSRQMVPRSNANSS